MIWENKYLKIMSQENPQSSTTRFVWNEYIAQDESAAKNFYTKLFGWTTAPFQPQTASPAETCAESNYTLFKSGGQDIGGMMKCPQPGLPAHWLPYVVVSDVAATVATAKKLGAQIVVEPFDIPTIGRMGVFIDPQGAPIGVIKPQM
jgi:predicted enzyme related to lactoylglutathione lyase